MKQNYVWRETFLQKILLAISVWSSLVGLAMSTDPLEVKSKGVQFNYEDSINGHGNFASYNRIVTKGPR